MLKFLLVYLIRMGICIINIFHIQKDKILFIPFNGEYYCNLKYIDQYLRQNGANLHIIWAIRPEQRAKYPQDCQVCTINSWEFFYHLMTAHFVVSNDFLHSYFYKKDGQYYINTWHGGGAYKRIAAVYKDLKDKWRWKRVKFSLESCDFIISSCQRFSEAITLDTAINKVNPHIVFLKFGMPRNDVFFSKSKMQELKQKVFNRYHISAEQKIILYAPTFRSHEFNNSLDVVGLLQVLREKFKKDFVLFLRSHPHVKDNIFKADFEGENIIDVSKYPDMQELLCAADVLITDYSSSMWDFSFTGKPCFIYANDIESYKADRNFHTPIEEWPFPVASNNEELQKNIRNFDEKKYAQDIDLHHRNLGSYEDGHAAERVSDFIIGLCNDKKK